jgi:glycosidase
VGRAFWRDFHAALHAAYPHLTTVGEVFNGDPEITSFFAGGVSRCGIDTGLDTPFDFPVHFALRNVLIGDKPFSELPKILQQDALYPHPERLVPFLGNHDIKRFFTASHESVPKLKLAVGILATIRGTPQLYSGDEIAMAGGDDPDNRRDFPGGFAGDAHNAFSAGGRTPVEQEVFAWTAGMLTLRRANTVLQQGIEQNLAATDDVFVFVRAPGGEGCSPDHSRQRVLVIVNKAPQVRSIDLLTSDTALSGCTEFEPMAPASGAVPKLDGAKLHIDEAAESMTLYRVR